MNYKVFRKIMRNAGFSCYVDDGTAYVFYFDDTTIDLANKSDYKAQCNTVRCVKDEKK